MTDVRSTPRVEKLLHDLLAELYDDPVAVNAQLARLEAEDVLGANDHVPPAGSAVFARAWVRAIAGTCFLPMSLGEAREPLDSLARRLAAALRARPFAPRAGRQVGQELVDLGIGSPEALGRTIDVIQRRFLPDLGSSSDEDRVRLQTLISELAAGFAEAMRDRVLAEQDFIYRATSEAAKQISRDREERLWHLATHDALTGLPNRLLFVERLDALFVEPRAAGHRIGLCFIDLDEFKSVNDALGHVIGDRFLVDIARRLAARFPEHLVARLGSDEFAILAPDTECVDEVVKVADAALTLIAEPTLIEHYRVQVSAGAGVVERALAGTDPGDLMRAADLTLHRAKSVGKNQLCVFDPDLAEADLARFRLTADLPRALDGDQFRLVYQPRVRLADNTVRGMEALLRWRHPELGELTPDSFLHLAEETGLVVPMGRWVLTEACQQAKRWQRQVDHPLPVSVNVSARELGDPGLPASVRTALQRSGLAPDLLELDVPESAVTSTGTEGIGTLHALAEMGVRIAIDDFGTGYSSLAYLRGLPIHALKLGPVFVTGVPYADHGDRAVDERILATVVRLADALDLTVTATGVETPEQARMIREAGCDFGQGWHFGLPVPAEAVTGRRSVMST